MSNIVNLTPGMKHEDRELVPVFLVRAMFGLMLGVLALVAIAQWTDRPNTGVNANLTVVAERSITLQRGQGDTYAALDDAGTVLMQSSDELRGFVGVMGLVIDRHRVNRDVPAGAPVRLIRREGGTLAVADDYTGMTIELIGYGADNVAAFAALMD